MADCCWHLECADLPSLAMPGLDYSTSQKLQIFMVEAPMPAVYNHDKLIEVLCLCAGCTARACSEWLYR